MYLLTLSYNCINRYMLSFYTQPKKPTYETINHSYFGLCPVLCMW